MTSDANSITLTNTSGSTFDSLAASSLGVTGNSTLGGTLSANNINMNGLLKAPQIRVTGTDPHDGIIIQNVDGTEVAKFHNDFRCRMNGDTTVLGNLTTTGNLSVSGTSNLGRVSQLMYSTVGSQAPVNGSTSASRSEGNKIPLYPSFSYYQTDYAIGIEPYNMFLQLQKIIVQMVVNFMVIQFALPQFQALAIW